MNIGETVKITRCLYPESCRFHGDHVGKIFWKGRVGDILLLKPSIPADQQGYAVKVADAVVLDKTVWAISVEPIMVAKS